VNLAFGVPPQLPTPEHHTLHFLLAIFPSTRLHHFLPRRYTSASLAEGGNP